MKFGTSKMIGIAALASSTALISSGAMAQEQARIELKSFHSASLEGNLEGNEPARKVFVVTPPGYDENPDAHYPVVYYLHGYWMPAEVQQEAFRIDAAVDVSAQAGQDFIMVMPDGFSKQRGSFYSNGPTVGDYEAMVAQDLVAWVDANFRTIADRESRGLAGHSMGGYGTIRIAMKHPEVFSSIYMMSACCLGPRTLSLEEAVAVEALSEEDVANADFGGLANVSTLVAWSPNPNSEHFLKADTGLREDGTLDPLVNQRLAANAPLVMLPQYLRALNGLEGFAMDIGDKDFLLEDNRRFREELDHFGVTYDFDLYDGDHGNRIGQRIGSHVLPFFANHLDRE